MTGRPCDWKFDQCPLPMANPSTTKLDIAANFVQVETFWRRAPQRSPTTLTNVRIAIRSNPSKCARVKATPSTVKSTCSCDTKGTTCPRYAAEATDKAAIDPPLATANNIHP